MLSERVYRWLLFVYPREHRREYGELMAQLFLDRMRWEGSGFRGLFVWSHMIFDLVGAAFKEHKEGVDMRKVTSIGIALAVLLVAGGIGAGVLLAQSAEPVVSMFWQETDAVADGESVVSVSLQGLRESETAAGGEPVVSVSWQKTDAVVDGEPAVSVSWQTSTLSGGRVFVLEDARTFSGTEAAVQAGAITQGAADEIVLSLAGDGSEDVWRYEGGVAGALQQAVEDGVISQAMADLILRSAGVQ